MNKMQFQVLEFHEKFGVLINLKPTIPNDDCIDLRISLIEEELDEFVAAAKAGDIVEVADALGDLLYVVYGAAICFGLEMTSIFNEIHRSNMSKANADGTVSRRADGKVLKSPLFSPPDLKTEVEKQSCS